MSQVAITTKAALWSASCCINLSFTCRVHISHFQFWTEGQGLFCWQTYDIKLVFVKGLLVSLNLPTKSKHYVKNPHLIWQYTTCKFLPVCVAYCHTKKSVLLCAWILISDSLSTDINWVNTLLLLKLSLQSVTSSLFIPHTTASLCGWLNNKAVTTSNLAATLSVSRTPVGPDSTVCQKRMRN